MKNSIIRILSTISIALLLGSFPLKLIAGSIVIDICRLVGFIMLFVVLGLRISQKNASLDSNKHNWVDKLTYGVQFNISFLIVILGCILTDVFDFWIYHSIAYVVCGLLFIVHPVVPKHFEANDTAVLWTRIAGIFLILIGVFTRAHY